ncbi:hypothetical protein MMC14_002295 [Varicellaria rhodocarpa]|nr:hypothetical protein [Varicellaria rhodocarpa]
MAHIPTRPLVRGDKFKTEFSQALNSKGYAKRMEAHGNNAKLETTEEGRKKIGDAFAVSEARERHSAITLNNGKQKW